MMTELLQIAAAGVGSLGFGVLFNIRGKKLAAATAGGLMAWTLYIVFNTFISSEPFNYLLVAVAVSLYAEIMARVMKTPNSTFILTSLVPLIPGGSLYYTMKYAFEKDFALFNEQAIHTLLLASALALGVILSTAFIRSVTHLRGKR